MVRETENIYQESKAQIEKNYYVAFAERTRDCNVVLSNI